MSSLTAAQRCYSLRSGLLVGVQYWIESDECRSKKWKRGKLGFVTDDVLLFLLLLFFLIPLTKKKSLRGAWEGTKSGIAYFVLYSDWRLKPTAMYFRHEFCSNMYAKPRESGGWSTGREPTAPKVRHLSPSIMSRIQVAHRPDDTRNRGDSEKKVPALEVVAFERGINTKVTK